MSTIRNALVIGGGIAGPVCALALRKGGVETTVFEAYRPGSNGIGGALALEPNGLTALDSVGAGDAVRAVADPVVRSMMAMNNKLVNVPPGPAGTEPRRAMRRDDLHRALHDVALAAGVSIVHHKRLVGVEERPADITATFEDGSTATADVLIGADGIHSRVRTLIDPNAPGPDYAGVLGFGSYVQADLDIEPGTIVFAFGRRAYYIYWKERNGLIAWGANLPWKEYLTFTEARAVPAQQWVDRLRETYAGDRPGELLAGLTTPENLVCTGALHSMPPVPRWHRHRMVLVGDAVHAPSNSTGQGASLAIESALEVARCLGELSDHTAAFAEYERVRRPRVEAVGKEPGAVAKTFMRH